MKLRIEDLKMYVGCDYRDANTDVNIDVHLVGTGQYCDYTKLSHLEHNHAECEITEASDRKAGWISYSEMSKDRKVPFKRPLEPIKIICSAPAVIVFWNDGTKTVCKAQNDDEFDLEKGFFACCAKKMFGNEGNYYNKFTKTPVTFAVDKKEKTYDKQQSGSEHVDS